MPFYASSSELLEQLCVGLEAVIHVYALHALLTVPVDLLIEMLVYGDMPPDGVDGTARRASMAAVLRDRVRVATFTFVSIDGVLLFSLANYLEDDLLDLGLAIWAHL